jgi:hypothetical protein
MLNLSLRDLLLFEQKNKLNYNLILRIKSIFLRSILKGL